MEKRDTPLPWDDSRLLLLGSLIRSTARFAAYLNDHLRPPTIMNYNSILQEHESGSCASGSVKGWVYVNILRKAVQDANGVALLSEKSLGSQALSLWRSLFETHVICRYIAKSESKDHLPCLFAIHSVIRATVRRWEEFNNTCVRKGKPKEYSQEEIDRLKDLYKNLIGKWGQDYMWTGRDGPRTLDKLAKATDSDMLFCRIANNEVHPTFGEAAAVTDLKLPLKFVPFLPIGIIHSVGEMSVEFQTAETLSDMTQRAAEFTTLPSGLEDSRVALKEQAEAVLRFLN